MGIASKLKQLHMDNIGKSTLLIITVFFSGLSWYAYTMIEEIINRPDSLVQVQATSAPAEADAPASAASTPAADTRN